MRRPEEQGPPPAHVRGRHRFTVDRAKRYSYSWVRVVSGRVAVVTRQLTRAKARRVADHDRENKRATCRMFGISGKRFRALERKHRRQHADS